VYRSEPADVILARWRRGDYTPRLPPEPAGCSVGCSAHKEGTVRTRGIVLAVLATSLVAIGAVSPAASAKSRSSRSTSMM
jgi:hypothetical protein